MLKNAKNYHFDTKKHQFADKLMFLRNFNNVIIKRCVGDAAPYGNEITITYL